MCLSAIYWSHIGKIFYGNTKKDAAQINFDDDFIYQEIPKKPQERKIPMLQLQRSEALKAFELWEQKTDKVTY
jgi:tRNA(Arg) A34 adenosine deaminase TadA